MQIQHRIGQLMGQVERLMADLQRNVKEVPYENMNLDALEPGEQMRDLSEMRSALQEMQDALREGRFEEAMALADQLGREIQSLTAALESDLEDMASGSQRVMSEELRDFLSELETISNREEAVHRQTEALKQAALDALSQHVREQLAPRIAEQLEAIQEVANRLARVDVDELHPDDKSQLVISQEAVGDLKETLSQEDLGGGLRMARELVRSLRELEREVEHGVERFREREGDSYRVRRKARNVRRLDRAGDHAQRVVRALEEMMPGPDDLLDRAQQRRLNRLSERQQRVGERVQRLRDRVGAIDAEHPGLGARLDEALQKSEAGMSEATERLSEHRPGPAEVHEQAAMESLRNARQAVERALGNPGRGGGGGLGASRPDNQVAIPDEAQHSVPREFRDELLRGINGRAPRQYRRLIEQYYEVLLQ
jgi:hypothetical protein